ncbi:hypothetical protein [Streptomyces cadmiisoli]|uniref:Uncharacterized protein n=1 Tax=Streptomyces cadmiisoli TaxID=2184053 RepID=A0A2Z4JDG4_9ACTN|nr:hypothetical protein [Streptomyces cadmiisoli]AWW43174.1 hypothetical protein DN051_41950 [Streptomyces cadmiisoli]
MHPILVTGMLPAVPRLLARCRALAAVSALVHSGEGAPSGPPVYTLRPSIDGSRHHYGPRPVSVGPVLSMAHDGHHFDVLFSEAGTLVWGLSALDEPSGGASHRPFHGEEFTGFTPCLPTELRALLPRQLFNVLAWCRPGDEAWHVLDPSGALSGDRALLHDLTAHPTGPGLKWLGSPWPAETLWEVLDLPSGTPAPTGPARGDDRGEEVFRCRDDSGLITTAVFRRDSDGSHPLHLGMRIGVPDDMVVVGGGAVTHGEPHGALLTASCPSPDGGAWVVSSKDHLVAQPHTLTGYAIGLAVDGVGPAQLASRLLSVRRVRGTVAAHPSASAAAPEGHVLIGGGFRVNWHDGTQALGPGSLATASFPLNGTSWEVRAKDHLLPHPCTVDAYAVGLRSSFTVAGRRYRVDRRVASAPSGTRTTRPSAVVTFDGSGHALTGVGAEVRYDEPGSMLWRLEPLVRDGGSVCVAASGKEHLERASATSVAFGLGVRLVADDLKRPVQ